MAKNILDFEKPIIELENKIEEMKKLEGHLDISSEVNTLEEKVNLLKKNIYDNLTDGSGSARSPPGTSVYSGLHIHDYREFF